VQLKRSLIALAYARIDHQTMQRLGKNEARTAETRRYRSIRVVDGLARVAVQ